MKNYITEKEVWKECNKCGRMLPADLKHFRRHSQTKDGLRNPCKECMGYKFSIKNTKGNLSKTKGYKLCKGCFIEFPSDKRYFQANNKTKDGLTGKCRECIKTDKSKNKSRTKEYLANYNSNYYKLNKEFVRSLNREYFNENRDKMLEYHRIYNNKRRAKAKGLGHELTKKEWEAIKVSFNNRCSYCHSKGDLEQDHFIPLAKGGEYSKENIIPACRSCNASKNDNDFFEWYPAHPGYSKDRMNKILKHLNYIGNVQQLSIF